MLFTIKQDGDTGMDSSCKDSDKSFREKITITCTSYDISSSSSQTTGTTEVVMGVHFDGNNDDPGKDKPTGFIPTLALSYDTALTSDIVLKKQELVDLIFKYPNRKFDYSNIDF